MRKLLFPLTDWVSTKRGMWITIIAWLVLMVGLSAGPRLGDYKVTNFQSLPDEAQSLIAEKKQKRYFQMSKGHQESLYSITKMEISVPMRSHKY